MTTLIKDNDIVLFQGDSITDAGRSREDRNDLGRGYPLMIASWFAASHPCEKVTFINRGVSGDRVKDLQARWREDCLDLKPNWLSILIGVNDTWRRYDSNDPTSTEAYEAGFRDLLTRARDVCGARIIILEPFLLPIPADRATWRVDLDPKIHAARRLACEFGAIYIPFDGVFASVAALRGPAFWASDGVHPTYEGHALIARHWLAAVNAV